ncbi:MAG: hypothetical protein AVO34_06825 [Firmicutes bacterium ML8_F2]|jgi:thymidine kinase|nr:MAG: hypothetical protein AVO34_06825 [Firmicutes bacterium ML8_F2]
MLYRPGDMGLLEIISSGAMFSGKTRTLLTRLETFMLAGRKVQLFCPKGSQERYRTQGEVVSHDGMSMRTMEINHPIEILKTLFQREDPLFLNTVNPGQSGISVVGIDEIMLFHHDIVKVVDFLVDHKFIVVASGLSVLSSGKPFGPMPELLAKADIITHLQAVCNICGNPATRTLPKFEKKKDIVIGKDYMALCRKCWEQKKNEEYEN